mgnify:CR=1 FL=1
MEAPAPKPINFSFLKKELTSEQGHKCSLEISYINDKFVFIIEKLGKFIKDKFRKEYTMSQMQENNYFKMFESPKEIIEELNEKIITKTPILTETENNSINLIIFLQNSKFRQVEFCLTKENLELKKDSEDLKSIIDILYNSVEQLKISNEELRKENKEIKLKLQQLEKKSLENGTTKPKDIPKKISDFFWINNEVEIVNSSIFCPKYPAETMLGKTNANYSLTDGDKNHYVEFSFKKDYFLKMIRISVDKQYECNLKNFRIENKSVLILVLKKFMESVASGKLNSEINSYYTSGLDELSALAKSSVEMQNSLRKMIDYDALTEINNRRYANIYIDKMHDEAGIKADYCIAIGDIDYFKRINDTYGHDAGDEILRSIAEILRRNVPRRNLVARWGGEEFIFAFNETAINEAEQILKKCLIEIRNTSFHYYDKEIRVTMSFGLAKAEEGKSADAIIMQADDMLYAAKGGGRNRIVL